MSQMPQQLAYEYTKQELTNLINYCISELKLPTYQIAFLLKDAYVEVNTQAQLEYQQIVQQYNAEQQEKENKENTKEQE